jgi:alpha-tubulin suppressor-like RCC1 family protein
MIAADETGRTRAAPAPAPLAGVTDAVQIGAGLLHVCALRRAGAIVCAGSNLNLQLGDGTNAPVALTPHVVAGGGQYLSIAAGLVHTCARHAAGVSCWGRNETGQVGDGTRDDRDRPVSVTALGR